MNLTVGQKVKVWESEGRRPEARDGEITKVGRTLVMIKWFRWGGWGGKYSHEEQFRIDTGRRNDRYGNSYFKTLEQAEADERIAAAREYLRAAGVEFTYRSSLTNSQIEELAAIVRNMLSEVPADYDSEVKGASE
jgi:hypothetical protein